MRKQFRNTLLDLAAQDPSIVLIFGDVSVYLFRDFQERYPARFYNLGICENTMVSVGAGLFAQGLIPFVHSIAPFITERCLEQIKLDCCYNRFGVNIVSCGASFDYSWDGATHHSYADLGALRLLPGLQVLQPGSCVEVDALLRQGYSNGQPTYYRLSDHPHSYDLEVELGRGVVLQDKGAGLTVVTAGPLLANVLPAVQDQPVNLLYFHTISPIDLDLLAQFNRGAFLVVHDGSGLWEAVNELQGARVYYHGYFRQFMDCYGTVEDSRRELALDIQGIRQAVKRRIKGE